ncbi:MAG TPA: glycosyltransferase family 39 protein [Terriglobales bacterium]|nr:glycosyltransferase family 39 protein [Terriglobales bacterium]
MIIGLLWGATYVAAMFTPPLLDDADSLHAEAAREILQRHDWVTLRTNGIRYLEKAPLMYWAIAASYQFCGVHDWSTRLPLVLGVLLLLLVTYALGKLAYGDTGGFWSAIVLGTSVGLYLFTRFQIPDMLVGLWLTSGMYFFLRSLQQEPPSRLTCWGLAASCALNVLTKSLIGLVFPAAIVGLYLILTGNLRHLSRLRPVSSTLVFLGISVPWHVLAALRNPTSGIGHGFLWFYFVNEQFLRYLNKRVPPGYDTVPLLIFWALLVVWLVPWALFLPQAITDVGRPWRKLHSRLDRRDQANLLFTIWAVVIVVFFSFSTRQEYYTLPAIPALALLVGGWLGKENAASSTSVERRSGRISATIFLAVSAVVFLAGVVLLILSRPPGPGVELADLLKKNSAEYNLSMGHFLDLTPQALGMFRVPLLVAVLSLLLGAGANWFLRRRHRPATGNAALILMMVALFGCVHSAFVTFSPILSSHRLAQAIQQHYRPGDIIVVDGEYHQASTLNFYTGIPLLILHEPSGNLWYGSKFSDAPRVFLTQSGFESLWSGPAVVFLWTDEDDPVALHGRVRYLLAHSGGKSILTNHPVSI